MTLKTILNTAALFGATLSSGMAFAAEGIATPNVALITNSDSAVTLVQSQQIVLQKGYFVTRDGSNLYNEYYMPDANTLKGRRHVASGPGNWSTWNRLPGTNYFRSSNGGIYEVLDQNRIVANNGRVLHRDTPISGAPGGNCIEVVPGFSICAD